MEQDSYRKLAEFLDTLPDGFGSSETGADLTLLQRLFTPAEAELARHLTLEAEPVPVIAHKAQLACDEAAPMLEAMAKKGLIFSIQQEDGTFHYQAVPFVVGIYEFQIHNLSRDFLHDVTEYWKTLKPRTRPQAIPQMRTIPVRESIELNMEVLPYEQVDHLIDAHDRYAVAPCICRHTAKMAGNGCDAPEETCLMFGEFADYYVRLGVGRAIDKAEVLDILEKANAANLVLQPSNSKTSAFICCCCGCCCGILGGLKRHPKPSEIVANAFIATLDADLCQACWLCLERCQMDALSEGEGRVVLDTDRCIGCGLCVSTCPTGALTLVRKPDSALTHPPDTLYDTWHIIAETQAEHGT